MNVMKKKMNNKGFSLVELIIVIAIMAVLVGVLAPTYIQYVERSRVSADAAIVDEFVGAMQVAASDPNVTLDASKEYKIESAASSNAITISNDLKNVTAFAAAVNTSETYTFKSTSYNTPAITITLAYNATNKQWQVTTTGVPNS